MLFKSAIQFLVFAIFAVISLPTFAAAGKPGEDLNRALIQLYQDKEQSTRLQAMFLSAGLAHYPLLVATLRGRVAKADPVEQVIIRYTIAVMTRDKKDIEAFLVTFPDDYSTFIDVFNAEWHLSANMSTGIADFLLTLVYTGEYSEKSLPKLASIIRSFASSEALKRYEEDPVVGKYLEKNPAAGLVFSNKKEDENFREWKPTQRCRDSIIALFESKDYVSRISAILMSKKLFSSQVLDDALQARKTKAAIADEILVLDYAAGHSNDFINGFPQTQKGLDRFLALEKATYKPPHDHMINFLAFCVQWGKNPEALKKLSYAVTNGKQYLQRNEYEQYSSLIKEKADVATGR